MNVSASTIEIENEKTMHGLRVRAGHDCAPLSFPEELSSVEVEQDTEKWGRAVLPAAGRVRVS